MSDKVKHPREQALQVAEEICQLLKPVTKRLIVAGSLRRKRKMVSDVEILYIPKFETRQFDLLSTYDHNLTNDTIQGALDSGLLKKRLSVRGSPAWGKKNKYAVHSQSGIPVDLFQATEENWFNYLVCRTGPAIHNIAVAKRAARLGLKWNPYGTGFTETKTGKELHVHSEEELYGIIEYVYLEPWERCEKFGTKQ